MLALEELAGEIASAIGGGVEIPGVDEIIPDLTSGW